MFMLYIPETDTLEVVYGNELGPVAETREGPMEWLTLDFDSDGRLLSMTIEHARKHAPSPIAQEINALLERSTAAEKGALFPNFDVFALTSDGDLNLSHTLALNGASQVDSSSKRTSESSTTAQ